MKSDLLDSYNEQDDYYQETKSAYADPTVSVPENGVFELTYYLYSRDDSSLTTLKIDRNGTVECVLHDSVESE